jgi:hypothetical protein
VGGVQVPSSVGSPQVQSHGGQLAPGAQSGQAQAHPPPPEPLESLLCWQTPERHGSPISQGMPIAYQTHALSVSAVQVVSWVWVLHRSVEVPASTIPAPPPVQLQGGHVSPTIHGGQSQTLVVGLSSPPLPPLATAPDPTQSQLQDGQLSPSAHAGHAQPQVPLSMQLPSVGSLQVQSHGGQLEPGMQDAHAHVQVPPPLPPPEQSHSMGGQVVPAGQYAGLTHAQPLPSGVRAWQ